MEHSSSRVVAHVSHSGDHTRALANGLRWHIGHSRFPASGSSFPQCTCLAGYKQSPAMDCVGIRGHCFHGCHAVLCDSNSHLPQRLVSTKGHFDCCRRHQCLVASSKNDAYACRMGQRSQASIASSNVRRNFSSRLGRCDHLRKNDCLQLVRLRQTSACLGQLPSCIAEAAAP